MTQRDKNRPPAPPATDEERFIEWLLLYGKDFAVYRRIYKDDLEKFLAINKSSILSELRNAPNEHQLSDRVGKMSTFYLERLAPSVKQADGLENLDSKNQAAVAMIEIKIIAIEYVLKYKYKNRLTQLSESICGRLEDIYKV